MTRTSTWSADDDGCATVMVDTINISSSNSARNRTRNVPGTSARRTTDGINLPLILLLAALGVSSLSSSSPPSSVDGFRPTPPPHYDGRPRHRHHPARSERRLRPPGPLLESSGGGDGQDTPGDTTAGGGAVGGGSSLDSILGRAGGGSRDGPLGFPGGGGGEGGGERFNPLSYARSGTGRRGGGGGATISVRKTRMMELTGELLNAVDAGNREDGGAAAARARARQILDRYRDFLLEPLEDDEAVLDADSIYSPLMSRSERYQAYRESMEERIKSSKSGQALAVLTFMRDYVLEFERR